eukprot:s4127_g2.t1
MLLSVAFSKAKPQLNVLCFGVVKMHRTRRPKSWGRPIAAAVAFTGAVTLRTCEITLSICRSQSGAGLEAFVQPTAGASRSFSARRAGEQEVQTTQNANSAAPTKKSEVATFAMG